MLAGTSILTRPHLIQRMVNGWLLQCADKSYSAEFSDDFSRHPKGKSYRFELRKGDVWVTCYSAEPSFRSEINTDDYVSVGSTQWYGFSLFIPKDFPIEDNRLVMGQWWSRSKISMGEVPKSPPLSQDFRNGWFKIRVRHSVDRVFKQADAPKETIYETKHLPLGAWNDFIYQIKWSNGSNGLINVWLNGKQVASYRGPVGYNDDIGPTFKFGLYRDATDKTEIIYYDEIRRGSSFQEVDPSILR